MDDNHIKPAEDYLSSANESSLPTQLPKTAPSANPSFPKNKLPIIIFSIFSLVIFSAIIFFGYQYLSKIQEDSRGSVTEQAGNVIPTESPTPALTEAIQFDDVVEWLPEPQKVASVGFFNLIDQYYPYKLKYCKGNAHCSEPSELSDKYEPKTTYYKVGTMISPYRGSPVYLAITKNLPTTHDYKGAGAEKDIAYDYKIISIFIKTSDNKFIVTSDYQNNFILCRDDCFQNQLAPSKEETNIIYRPDLLLDKAGSRLEYVDPETKIKFQIWPTDLFYNNGLFLVKDFGDGYALYSKQNIKANSIKFKTIINPALLMKLPTGLAADINEGPYSKRLVYQKGNDYSFPDDLQLLWTSPEKPQPLPKEPSTPDKGLLTDYTAIAYILDYDGCRGNITLEDIVSNSEVLDIKDDLVQVATTSRGDVVYEIKNKDLTVFQQFWHQKIALTSLRGINYNDYLALKPILVLKDPLGIYRLVFREDLVNSKCWGEPLIYLYPKEPIEVKIFLDKVDLTKTEPDYNGGWHLIAYPNGDIYSPIKQRKYPYLFWEGSAPLPSSPVAQEVVKQAEVHNYFENTLTILGLNNKEKQDFEKYWEPKLNNSPYYLISFYDAKQINQVAPLNIIPSPDTIIRLLMTYEEIDNNKVKITPMRLDNYQTPLRRGFTVVEWGGILH